MDGQYRIRVGEQVGPAVGALFSGFAIVNEPDGGATLVGRIRDQAELRGILQRVFDLGLTLVALTPE